MGGYALPAGICALGCFEGSKGRGGWPISLNPPDIQKKHGEITHGHVGAASSISILTKESQSDSRDLANSPQRIPKAPAPRTPFFRALVVNRHSEFSFRFVFKSPKSKTKSQRASSQTDYI